MLARLRDPVLTPNAEAVKKLASNRAEALGKLVGYYVSTGAQSLRVNLILNAGALRAWRSAPADSGLTMTENDRRTRYVRTLKQSVEMLALPAAPSRSLEDLLNQMTTTISGIDRFGSSDERATLAAAVTEEIRAGVASKSLNTLGKLRAAVADTLNASKNQASFAAFTLDGQSAEQIAVTTLQGISLLGLSATEMGSTAAQAARIAGVTNLSTFAHLGDDYANEIAAIKSQLVVIRDAARQNGQQAIVDHVRALIAALK